jgi:DNA (cytosine-5)-methyltransferase 1
MGYRAAQPKFDWYVPTIDICSSDVILDGRKDPHRAIKATQGDKAEVKRRAAVGIPAFEAASSHGAYNTDEDSDPFPGYPDGVSYASAPRTRYQARAREGISEDADVELHYTARYSEVVIERTCNVAIKPGADWRSLPRQLQMKKTDGSSSRDTRFSRINGDGHFRTAMTTVMPHSQGATVIHPSVCPRFAHLLQGHLLLKPNSKSEYSPSASALGRRAFQTPGSSCP